jgi:response regulator NasT
LEYFFSQFLGIKGVACLVSGEILLVMRQGNICSQVERIITSLGHRITEVCHSGGNAIRMASVRKFDIVLCSSSLPDMKGLDLAVDIADKSNASVLLITSADEKIYIENQFDGYDITCLVKPVSKMVLQNSLEMAMRFRQRLYGVTRERDRLQKTLDRRAVVAKAKAVLMEKYEMSEPEAYRALQKTSMDSGIPIREVAQTVIDTDGKEFYRYW